MCWEILEKNRNLGFWILRFGIGAMFMHHGWGKLVGGPELWTKVGGAVGFWGVPASLHQLFGLLAAASEFGGGLCLILGLFFRPACFFLFVTMAVATTMHLRSGDGLQVASHAIEAAILFLSLLFIGPGPNSLDERIQTRKKKR